MILIFDYFETILNTKSMDFNRGLYVFWESYYREKCPFEDMKKYGEDLFEVLLEKHRGGEEYPFVKNELPLFAKKFGGDKVTMSVEEEADFLMRCNDFVLDPEIERFLQKCSQMNIPMYVVGAHNAGIKSAWLNKKNGNDENGWATYNIASADQLITILEGEYEY